MYVQYLHDKTLDIQGVHSLSNLRKFIANASNETNELNLLQNVEKY